MVVWPLACTGLRHDVGHLVICEGGLDKDDRIRLLRPWESPVSCFVMDYLESGSCRKFLCGFYRAWFASDSLVGRQSTRPFLLRRPVNVEELKSELRKEFHDALASLRKAQTEALNDLGRAKTKTVALLNSLTLSSSGQVNNKIVPNIGCLQGAVLVLVVLSPFEMVYHPSNWNLLMLRIMIVSWHLNLYVWKIGFVWIDVEANIVVFMCAAYSWAWDTIPGCIYSGSKMGFMPIPCIEPTHPVECFRSKATNNHCNRRCRQGNRPLVASSLFVVNIHASHYFCSFVFVHGHCQRLLDGTHEVDSWDGRACFHKMGSVERNAPRFISERSMQVRLKNWCSSFLKLILSIVSRLTWSKLVLTRLDALLVKNISFDNCRIISVKEMQIKTMLIENLMSQVMRNKLRAFLQVSWAITSSCTSSQL